MDWNWSIYRQRVKVGSKSIISPMSYVINDIPDNSIVSGNPAKVIKTID